MTHATAAGIAPITVNTPTHNLAIGHHARATYPRLLQRVHYLPMQNDEWKQPPFTRQALYLFGYIDRHGGCRRIKPLIKWSGLAPEALCAAINELVERCWIKITLRPPRDRQDAALRDIDRLTTTSFGRWRAPHTWSRD